MKQKTMAQTIARQKIVGEKHFQKPLFYHDTWMGLGPVALSPKHMIKKRKQVLQQFCYCTIQWFSKFIEINILTVLWKCPV